MDALNYNYAVIDPETKECTGILSRETPFKMDILTEIPSFNEEYVSKFYNDGVWYTNSGFTTVWEV